MWKVFTKIAELVRNGRPYQVSRHTRELRRSPVVNVDGTPMVGRTDIRGRAFGSTGGYRGHRGYGR